MSTLGNIEWTRLLFAACTESERRKTISLEVDPDIVGDIEARAAESLNQYRISRPNAAKVAGHVCYWLCRLKPVRNVTGAPSRFLAINEEVALYVGLAICDEYFDDVRAESVSIDPSILKDWVTSLRYNTHSPYALAIAFELLTGRRAR